MNERIRQLADEAGLRFTQLMSNPMVPVVDGRETDLAKFAELIVKECIQVGGPEDSYTDEWFKAKADSVAKIKEHFGVEG